MNERIENLLKAADALHLEAIHYKNTGRGRVHLENAVDQYNRARALAPNYAIKEVLK